MVFKLESSAFSNEGTVPSKYTCDGPDVSPPLKWSGAPEGTKTFAMICDDPDAPMGTWVHWVMWNIPANVSEFKEGMSKDPKLSDGTMQGISDFKRPGYGGPCPPSGTHRYYFKLYALDAELSLPESTTKADLEKAIKGHILAEAKYMGTYSRNR
jgi:Raf kinase inhibitor-like YbhB/YbcL family protein